MKPHVLIATPSYDGKVCLPWVDSLTEMFKDNRYDISYKYIAGDSLITRARNKLFTNFIYETQYTHLLWIDSDVVISPDGIIKMLSKNVDVITAPVPLKRNVTEHGLPQSTLGFIKEINESFYEISYAATGCFMISRNAAESLAQFCIENDRFYFETPIDTEKIFDVFQVGVFNKIHDFDFDRMYQSEDWHLSFLLRNLGFSIYSDSSFYIYHIDSPRNVWFRPPCPLSETIINKQQDKELPENLRHIRWTTNDTMFKVDGEKK